MSPLGGIKKIDDGLIEVALIPFDRQHIIGAFLNDLLHDLPLATPGIQRDNTTLQFQQFQKVGNGSNFIGFLRRFQLT
jgi:hypothetical protein